MLPCPLTNACLYEKSRKLVRRMMTLSQSGKLDGLECHKERKEGPGVAIILRSLHLCCSATTSLQQEQSAQPCFEQVGGPRSCACAKLLRFSLGNAKFPQQSVQWSKMSTNRRRLLCESNDFIRLSSDI